MKYKVGLLLLVFVVATPVVFPEKRLLAFATPTGATEPLPADLAGPYPSTVLVQQCHDSAVALRGKLDKSFVIVESAPFVVAGDMPESQVRQYLAENLLEPAAIMWKSYFVRKPGQPITAILLSGRKQYEKWSRVLFHDNDLPYFGYYKSSSRTLMMNVATGTSVVIHELTHALMAFDFPNVPLWMTEGMASLHEQCLLGENELVGQVNWRLPVLQEAIRTGRLRALKDLVSNRDFYEGNRLLNYAHARFFIMYLQQQGVLREFYAYFRDHYSGRGSDVRAIEHVLGKPIVQVDGEYVEWVKSLHR